MSYHDKSVILEEVEVQAVKAAVATIKAKLLFLARLTADERKPCLKLEDRQRSASPQRRSATAAGGLLPQSFDGVESAPEVDFVAVLIEFVGAVEEMISEVEAARLTTGRNDWRESDAGSLMQTAQQLEKEAARFDDATPSVPDEIKLTERPHRDSNN